MFAYIEDLRPLEIHVQVGEPSVEALEKHFAYMGARLRSRATQPGPSRFAYVVQVSGREFRQANAAERKALSDWMQRDAALLRVTSLGVGFVIDSALIRGALTAVFWLSSTPVPYRVHATLDEAVEVALREIRGAGVPLPAALEVSGMSAVRALMQRVLPQRATNR